MNREQRLEQIERALGDRILIWFGIRGDDASALMAVRNFRACFSITAPLQAATLDVSDSIETRTRRRVDLDEYDIDLDTRSEVDEFRRELLAWSNHPSALAAYRPAHIVSAVTFVSAETCYYLGMFKDRQVVFEHKPWVESELTALGLRCVPWRYVADDNRMAARQMLRDGPIVLRASRRSGGAGISMVRSDEELAKLWPDQGEHFVAVAPFLSEAVPVNVGACVFPDGVAVHPGSLQLIGLTECTNRVFGYCGNDFGAFASIPEEAIEEIDQSVRRIGDWLRSMGYLGAFGADFLVDRSGVQFCEVNARFQGSTALSADLAASLGEADILLDHIAAFLGIGMGQPRTLARWAEDLEPANQVLVHNQATNPVRLADMVIGGDGVTVDRLPASGVAVEPGGVTARLGFPETVTASGLSVDPKVLEAVGAVVECFAGLDAEEPGS